MIWMHQSRVPWQDLASLVKAYNVTGQGTKDKCPGLVDATREVGPPPGQTWGPRLMDILDSWTLLSRISRGWLAAVRTRTNPSTRRAVWN